MGCTSSKENTNPPPSIITDNNQQLINEHFRKWLKLNRPKADEYVLNGIISTTKQSTNIDDYRPIVSKALDLLSENSDIKTINKLNKLVQKEVSLASPKKVAHTIDILKQTAEKLRQGQINFDNNQQQTTTTNGEITNNTKTSENKHGQMSSGEPGIVLKEALEKARILFYKGKQAAIFANPNGGYDVRIIDENDDVLNQDGNLLRSIIVTEVKLCPKPPPPPTTTTLPQFTSPPPPPPPTKLLDERQIGDDFRRSIDAALKGLEAIYQTSPIISSEQPQTSHINQSDDHLTNIVHKKKVSEPSISQIDIQPKLVGAVDNINEIMLDTIETTTGSQIGGNPIPLNNDIERRENLLTNQSLSLHNEESISFPHEKIKSNNENRPKSFNVNENNDDKNQYNFNKRISFDETGQNLPKSINKIEEYNKTLSESLSTPVDMNTIIKSPSHNVTYTEIIHSESHDGEQSRRFVTESYDELPSKDDEKTTSLKVTTKSEFSNHPSLGEKIMEQSVQVITVKVRNETVTQTSNNEISYEKQSVQNDANPIDMII